jgi:hypothetical protein
MRRPKPDEPGDVDATLTQILGGGLRRAGSVLGFAGRAPRPCRHPAKKESTGLAISPQTKTGLGGVEQPEGVGNYDVAASAEPQHRATLTSRPRGLPTRLATGPKVRPLKTPFNHHWLQPPFVTTKSGGRWVVTQAGLVSYPTLVNSR